MDTHDQARSDNTRDRDVALAFLARLHGAYGVAQAIMFGSRARGDHRPDSDLDLAPIPAQFKTSSKTA
jgi:predicted nucleotidyltransferase